MMAKSVVDFAFMESFLRRFYAFSFRCSLVFPMKSAYVIFTCCTGVDAEPDSQRCRLFRSITRDGSTLRNDAQRWLLQSVRLLVLNTGTVKWFNPVKGYGFIEPESGGSDAFVHISAVERAGLDSLKEGQKVQYELVRGQNGKSAAENLKILR
jgi:CspA family cold shock protein